MFFDDVLESVVLERQQLEVLRKAGALATEFAQSEEDRWDFEDFTAFCDFILKDVRRNGGTGAEVTANRYTWEVAMKALHLVMAKVPERREEFHAVLEVIARRSRA